MQHTFLFEEGHWVANGIFLDHQNNQFTATAKMHTTHQEGIWLYESVRCFNTTQPIESFNCGHIIPFVQNKDTTSWKSSDSILGMLEGKFVLISNTIISSYQSLDNFYRGTECFIMLNRDYYENKGLLFTEDGKVSSWLMRLNRTLKTKT